MRVNYLTIFPEIFPGVLETSILGKANEKGLVEYNLIDIRDYAKDKHRMVDDKAFGGEAGMVLMIEPLDNALNSIAGENRKNSAIILTDAAGTPFNQRIAGELAEKEELTFICGRYKGVDERIKGLYNIKPLSIGDYVINGGELPALVMTEAVVRLIPGVLGNIESAEEDSHFNGLLSSPVYTRPAEYKNLKVPEVLLSGNHARIYEWRYKTSLERTERIRPDLYHRYKVENSC
ncbi:MAG: tRNA (guanosine(37)-N1)-methyltransferase TrmD [candidate division Zixibacteria bacterium]|nr:tRNA (guanosine(37)-N1)-methyltransferase TrmD [candidate division Zixibacteria bacterium]